MSLVVGNILLLVDPGKFRQLHEKSEALEHLADMIGLAWTNTSSVQLASQQMEGSVWLKYHQQDYGDIPNAPMSLH